MLNTFFQYLDKLPPTSQAAIIASFVTLVGAVLAATIALIGIVINHRGNERRFAKQLAHDREQKRIEREMDLRREVYLDTAEAIVASLELIARYADIEIPRNELSTEYSEKRSAISKVHLIGHETTVNALLEFTHEFSVAVMRLALLREPLLQMRAKLQLLNEQIQAFGKERDRMVDLMKQLNFEGNQETHRWEFVRNTFEFETKRVNDSINEQQSLNAKLKTDWIIFAAECFSTSNKLSALLPPAVKAVRDELELPLDYEMYKATIDEGLRRNQESLTAYLSKLA